MKKIVLIVIDGFGHREENYGNAINNANMKNYNSYLEKYPHSFLEASGPFVGLSEGQFGNSEVGHMTIGAGRLLKQSEILVNEFLESSKDYDSFNKLLNKDKNEKIHLMGLLSDGNVHAGIDDFINMYNILVKEGFKNIIFHLITDGRDTPVNSSYSYIKQIEDLIKKNKVGKIGDICGRFYAMDRDGNYKKTKIYYDLITSGKGTKVNKIKSVIDLLYEKNVTDEFIVPLVINDGCNIDNNDTVIWMNYRADRSKQILNSLTNNDFNEFRNNINNIDLYTFFEVDKNIKSTNFIENQVVENSLGLYLSKLELTQARIAESEKFAHVTYFFDNGYQGKINKCNIYEIPSPKVKTYDLKPEMSIVDVTKKVIECINSDIDFILVNFANPDMVGHTGDMKAAIRACSAVDLCLEKIVDSAGDNFYNVIITADHGNSDIMIDEEHNPVTTHTLSKVPFIILDESIKLKEEGDLTNIAPTVLEYMEIALPDEMKDTPSLLIKE